MGGAPGRGRPGLHRIHCLRLGWFSAAGCIYVCILRRWRCLTMLWHRHRHLHTHLCTLYPCGASESADQHCVAWLARNTDQAASSLHYYIILHGLPPHGRPHPGGVENLHIESCCHAFVLLPEFLPYRSAIVVFSSPVLRGVGGVRGVGMSACIYVCVARNGEWHVNNTGIFIYVCTLD